MYRVVGSFLLSIAYLCGESVMIDGPAKITPQWEEKVLGIKYGVTTLDKAVDEMVSGLISDTFDALFIQKISEAIKKQPTGEGVFEEYWGNGTLKAKLFFKDGKAHGHQHGWYDNGVDAFKGFFCEGVKQGIHITFFRKEPDELIKDARILVYNEKGKLDGRQQKCYEKGNLMVIVIYENGLANGALTAWDEKEKKYLLVDYKRGLKRRFPPPSPGWRKQINNPDEKYVSEVSNQFAKEAFKEFGVRANGGGAGMPYDVESISVSFTICKKGTIEEARELIIKLTEKFKEIVNKHEKIRPYLRQYPFTRDRVEVTLSFTDNMGLHYQDGSIARVSIGSLDEILYSIDEPNSYMYKKVAREPYEKGVEIMLAKEKADLENLKKK